MGLENLKSIFSEGAGNPFTSTPPGASSGFNRGVGNSFTTSPIDNQTPVLDEYTPSNIESDVVLDEYPGITKYVSPFNNEYDSITFGNNFYYFFCRTLNLFF